MKLLGGGVGSALNGVTSGKEIAQSPADLRRQALSPRHPLLGLFRLFGWRGFGMQET